MRSHPPWQLIARSSPAVVTFGQYLPTSLLWYHVYNVRLWRRADCNRRPLLTRGGPSASLLVQSGHRSRPVQISGWSGPARPRAAARWMWILDTAFSMDARSALVSSTLAAPRFPWRQCRLVVLGIGTIQGLWANSQASATWAGVASRRSASEGSPAPCWRNVRRPPSWATSTRSPSAPVRLSSCRSSPSGSRRRVG